MTRTEALLLLAVVTAASVALWLLEQAEHALGRATS